MFVDWKCCVCEHNQTSILVEPAKDTGYFPRLSPCARCRVLHIVRSYAAASDPTNVADLPIGPNGHPITVGPHLYAKITQPVPVEHAPLQQQELDAQ